jgi:Importin repeat
VAGLTQVFTISLVHTSGTVRVAALRAACSLLQDLPLSLPADTVASAAALVPPMLNVMEAAVTEGDEDAACTALDAIRAIADSRPALLKPSLALIARAVLTIAGASSLAASTRQMALELLVTFCEKAPAALRKGGQQIVSAVIPLVLDLLAQVENDDDDNDSSNNESEWVLKADPSAWSNECGTANDDDDEDEVSYYHYISNNTVTCNFIIVCVLACCHAASWLQRAHSLVMLTFNAVALASSTVYYVCIHRKLTHYCYVYIVWVSTVE